MVGETGEYEDEEDDIASSGEDIAEDGEGEAILVQLKTRE